MMNKELIYLMSGNLDPAKDTDKFHLDLLRETDKERPNILLFATASTGTDWHQSYLDNLKFLFSKYKCEFQIIDDPELDIPAYLKDTDVVYFLGGSPYKHTKLTKYREFLEKVPIKVGTSAGAIYLSHPVFYFQKDDYLVSVPEMLGLVNIHILPHSELHREELVAGYLEHEAGISFARFYQQVCLKIKKEQGKISHQVFVGGTLEGEEKIEFFLRNGQRFQINKDHLFPEPLIF